jgi:two-component system chemotaxis sensor kinase CheA
MEDFDTIREFLIESNENLGRLDQEIVELEKDPTNNELVASIFRTIHTIKGTCGFLGFEKLTGVNHSAESILSQVRDGKRRPTNNLISIILESVDATRVILDAIERTSGEGDNSFDDLKVRLHAFSEATEETEGNYVRQVTVEAPRADDAAAAEPATPPASPASIEPVSAESAVFLADDIDAETAILMRALLGEQEDIEELAVAEPFQAAQPSESQAVAGVPEREPADPITVATKDVPQKQAAAAMPPTNQTPMSENKPNSEVEAKAPVAPPGPVQPVAQPADAAAEPGQTAPRAVAAAAGAVGPGVAERGVTAKSNAVLDSTIRVDVGLLDKLMNLVGELVLARNQVLQFTARLEAGTFNATSQRLNLITSELQESVMKTRMQPIGIVWGKFPRVVRDLAAECGKYIQLNMDGAETELDRTIIEAIKDPLTHIVRNSCDHGIERPDERVKRGKTATGHLILRAFHEGGHVNIEISDDGGGVSPEKVKNKAVQKGLLSAEQAQRLTEREAINLIFLPGFSTAEKVSNISGRGVGMDVVKTNIERIGGVVDLASSEGQGTTIKIKIPLTLAIIPGLVVMGAGERFVIPQVSLLELIRLEGENGMRQIERVHGTPVYRRRGKLLPLTFLNEILKVPGRGAQSEVVNIVVLQAEDSEFGLVVDGIHDTQEIVVKPLGKRLKGLSMYSGATIMGDGKVALILDVLGIAQRSGVLRESREIRGATKEKIIDQSAKDLQSMLLFSAGRFDRLAVPLGLVARLEEIPSSKVEQAAGRMVVQYRGQILPLVSLAGQLDPSADTSLPKDQNVQVVVFSNGDRLIGLVVDRILDIVEEQVTVRKSSEAFGLMGSAVVGQKVTDFVDLHEIIANSGEKWVVGHSAVPGGSTVMVLEKSAFARAHLRSSLEMAGYRVVEASGFQDAVDKLLREKVSIIAATADFSEVIQHVKRNPKLNHVRLLGLLAEGADPVKHPASELFEDSQMKFDRKAMLHSLERLAEAVDRQEHELAGVSR